ncbi:helix-turn-helix domain-containing GNAT family N-acetyltransferase [Agrobacterium rhizogenes]|uniref:bifunctional helix-turn-helix transcriptional regulator/GNAT family N-acetyltransferase n=1 Tax=Rhizobium rhizogenes TaxID=359 RepID=UPI0022B6F790|nr:helix-turn-helix domain-containing GNAT family N-acetyltransferase [Rhizobium rhizogenes]MCZ7449210.1 helix-turn-helix domain-containing GNAT family N-acetyltransferase [Rhizobium rhizogenes]
MIIVARCNHNGSNVPEQFPAINDIRSTSRQLVRELGFMGGDFAGTDLPPSSVHALIEIEACAGITAKDLGKLLRLEKSSVSRMLRKLILSGDIVEQTDDVDNRIKRLRLTGQGREKVSAINGFANRQVSGALAQLTSSDAHTILEGLRLYAGALGAKTGTPAPAIDIKQGYRPGIIARITQMHALYYARTSGFGQRFESVVAEGLAAFCNRLQNPRNAIWVAMRGQEIIGSVAIDGEDLGADIAHLRWFIVDDGIRGGGVGRRLLATALAFADQAGFAETHLWTFNGLLAARHLYETHGFTCTEEYPGSQWGSEVLEQRFIRPRPE